MTGPSGGSRGGGTKGAFASPQITCFSHYFTVFCQLFIFCTFAPPPKKKIKPWIRH